MDKLDTDVVAERFADIRAGQRALMKAKDDLQKRCSHHDKAGERMVRATGGGFGMCVVCESEID